MKRYLTTALAAGIAAALLLSAPAEAKTRLKAASTPPGTPPFLFVSAFSDVINKHAGDIEIQLNATGVATRHYVDATKGNVDLMFISPLMHVWMSKGQRVYAKIKHGPEIANKVSVLFHFKLAVYHVVTRADSGITSIADFKGKKIFLGPPAGAATVIAAGIVRGASGLEQGKDFEAVRLPWGAGIEAFRNRQVAAMIQPASIPAASIQQIALTTRIRLLGIPPDRIDSAPAKRLLASPGRTREVIKAGTYGSNQVNTEDVISVGSWGGIGIRTAIPDEIAYKMTKTFWENVDDVYKKAANFKAAITRETIFTQMASPLHPGAARYYREVGIEIPKGK